MQSLGFQAITQAQVVLLPVRKMLWFNKNKTTEVVNNIINDDFMNNSCQSII